jgi:hypothetical protein
MHFSVWPETVRTERGSDPTGPSEPDFSGKEHLFFSTGETTFTNYNAEVPEEDLIRIAFDRQALRSAVELVL